MMVTTFFLSSLLVAGSSAAHVGSSPTRSVRELVTRRQEVSEVPEQCFLDSYDLVENNPSLQEAEDALTDEFVSALDACPEDGLETVCDIDFSLFPSTDDYVSACAAAGGVIYDTSVVLGCSGTIFDNVVAFSLTYENSPACLSVTCDIDQVEEFLDSASNTFLDMVESTVNTVTGVDTLECNYDFSHTDSNGVSLAELRESETEGGTAPTSAGNAFDQMMLFTLGAAIASLRMF